MKLLYLPNEVAVGDQVGPRLAFQQMLAQGELTAYEAVSYLVHAKSHGPEAALAEIESQVLRLQPDVLMWQHIGLFPVSDAFMTRLKRGCPSMRIVYHEGDMYGGWAKRTTPSMACLIRHADACALVGTGNFARQVKRMGAKAVFYSPHSVDTHRFGSQWTPTEEREFDVVMIGNRVRSLLPWRYMPGARQRARLVAALTERFKHRFAVFGQGWSEFSSNRGPLPFDQQEATVRRAKLSVSWDHFDQEASYFSDRVPISLLSGVPHVTNYQPDYEKVFGVSPPLFWAKSVEEMVQTVESLVSRPMKELNQIGQAAVAYGLERFHAEVVYRKLLNDVKSLDLTPRTT